MSSANPFGFLPAPARPADADAAPDRHGALAMDRWSGRLRLRIIAETALLISDQEPGKRRTRTIDGVLAVAPSSVKGMIRTEYEMVTNSRYGVFGGHDRRLGYRRTPTEEAAALTPVRVAEDGWVELLEGADRGGARLQKACWVPRYSGQIVPAAPPHGTPVWAWAVPMRKEGMHPIEYYRALSMRPDRHPSPGPAAAAHERGNHVLLDSEPFELRGWYVDNGQNMRGKHDERIFWCPALLDGGAPPRRRLADDAATRWADLMSSYADAHTAAELAAAPTTGAPQWSRHLLDPEDSGVLRPGTLAYAEVPSRPEDPVRALYPVALSRVLYDTSPGELARAARLAPAQRHGEFSPADQLFGWVSTARGGGRQADTTPVRGRVRVGPVEVVQAVVEKVGRGLAVLGQPRPTQDLFYAARDDQGTPLTGKGRGYRAGQGLRGRKVYPHQPRTGQWLRNGSGLDGAGAPLVDSQNTLLVDQVAAGAELEVDVHLTDVTADELGALLLVLDGEHHKLGGGKPLGLGSVALEVLVDESDLRLGEDWYCYFSLEDERLTDGLDAATAQRLRDAARERMHPSVRTGYDAYRAGFRPGVEVRYPADPDDPASHENRYKWFVANRKADRPAALPPLGGVLPDHEGR